MTTQMIICFAISAVVIAGYIWNKLSVGTVGCIGIVLFLLTGCIGPKDILGNIGNANLVMITSMFVISEGFKRTKAIHLVASTVKKISKGSMVMVMLGFTLATVMAATFTGSAVAAFCILAMLAELNGNIAANGYEQYTMEAMDLFKGRGMSLLILILYTTFVGFRFAPEKPIVASKDSSELSKRVAHHEPLKRPQEISAIAIFCLVSLCLIFNTPLNNVLAAIGGPNLAAWEISFIGAVATVATGVLSSKEACASMPIDLTLMVAGGLCMGSALANTGAGDLIGNAIASTASSLGNPYLIGALFYLIPFFLTQIMQNRTVMAIFAPIAILACKSMGADCTGPLLLVASACCTAFMTPMATPTVPMVMGIGGYDMKSNMKQSILPAILLSVANILWVMTIYPL